MKLLNLLKTKIKLQALKLKNSISKSEPLIKMPLVFDHEKHGQPHTTVYRMEDKHGQGPYRHSESGEQKAVFWPKGQEATGWEDPQSSSYTPAPHRDKGFEHHEVNPHGKKIRTPKESKFEHPPLYEGKKFGFRSEKQAKKWFSPREHERLKELGFSIKPRKAKKVWAGKHQVFFESHEDEPKLKKDSSIMAMEHGSPMTKDEYEKAQKQYIKAKLYKLRHKIKKTQDITEFKPKDKIFVSGDGDGIGSKVEQKVMANDLEGLLAQSKKIENGQIHVKTEFEKLGGKMLVYGGDDSLALISKEHIGKVESIRQGYKDKTDGFTITFGVGNTMRDAVKALVYAKLTGKNRTEFWSADLNQKLEDIAKPQTPKEKYESHGLLPDDIGKSALRKENWGGGDWDPNFHGWISHTGKYHPIKEQEIHEHHDIVKPHVKKYFGEKGEKESKQYKRITNDWSKQEARDTNKPHKSTQHDPAHYLHNSGWIQVGVGAEAGVKGRKDVLDDPSHPATKALAQQWKKSKFHLNPTPHPSTLPHHGGMKITSDMMPHHGKLNVMHAIEDKVKDVSTGGKHHKYSQEHWVTPKMAANGNFKKPSKMQLFRSEDIGKSVRFHEDEVYPRVREEVDLIKGKKDLQQMYKPEHAGHKESGEFTSWASKTLPNANWQTWAVRHHREKPADFTPKVKEELKHYSSMKHIPTVDKIRFEKEHDLHEGIKKLQGAEKQHGKQLKTKKNLVLAPKGATKIVDVGKDEHGNGMAWHNLNTGCSAAEGKALGHCGNEDGERGDKIHSLRTEHKVGDKTYHEPHLTFVENKGAYGQMKGRANTKPTEKYHGAIKKLLMHTGHRPVGGGYLEEENFHMDDLSEKHAKEVTSKHPHLGIYSKHGTPEHISQALKHKDEGIRHEAIKHPKATKEHISQALKDKNEDVRWAAVDHPNATHEHISHALKDENQNVRAAAYNNFKVLPKEHQKKITEKEPALSVLLGEEHSVSSEAHIAALKHSSTTVRATAAAHPKSTPEHISHALKDKEVGVRRAAADNPNANKEHISYALKDKHVHVRLRALYHPKVTSEHVSQALKDKRFEVRASALQHPKVTHEHALHALKDKEEHVRDVAEVVAAKHPKATPEYISQALKHKNKNIRWAAAKNPSATHEHISHALKDENHGVRMRAVEHPNATKEHIAQGLKDREPYVRNAAEAAAKRFKKSDPILNKLKVIKGEIDVNLKKYVVRQQLGTQDKAHGWISPKGEYHHLKAHEEHGTWMTDNHGMQAREAHNKDWLAIGAGGYHNVEGNEKVLSDHKHPATKTARKLAGKHFGSETELAYEDKDKIKSVGTRLWEKFGSHRGPIFKSEEREQLSEQLKRIHRAVVAKGGTNKNKIDSAKDVFKYGYAESKKNCGNCKFFVGFPAEGEEGGACELYSNFNDTQPELYALETKTSDKYVCNLHKDKENEDK